MRPYLALILIVAAAAVLVGRRSGPVVASQHPAYLTAEAPVGPASDLVAPGSLEIRLRWLEDALIETRARVAVLEEDR